MTTEPPEDEVDPEYESVRVTPVQLRSSKRVSNILDAAAGYIQENGYETLTTAIVAKRSAASIGTVYRYFPDRLAMLRTLAARNLGRAEHALSKALTEAEPKTLSDALDVVAGCMEDLYRNEPGYRSVRAGDPIDIRPMPVSRMGNQHLEQLMIEEFSQSLSISFDSKARLALETGFDALDSLLARAFKRIERGDKTVVTQARRIFHLIVEDGLA